VATKQLPILKKPYRLWAIPEPWADRPTDAAGNVFRAVGVKTGGDALRSTAKGWRPPSATRFQELERKATILGGIMTLQALGVEPWAGMNLKKIPAFKLRDDRTALALLHLVQRGAKAEGKTPPKYIKDASEYIRKRVIEEEAGGPAWAARAMHLSMAGQGATDKRAKVEGAISAGTGLAAKGLYAAAAASAPTIIGPIILGTVGGILDGVSLTMTVLSGRSKIEEARAKGEANGYALQFQQLLEKRAIREQKELLTEQIRLAEAQRQLEDEAARVQAEQITRYITAAVWISVVGGAGLLTYTVIQRRRTRAST
jgi:hypothetical protein